MLFRSLDFDRSPPPVREDDDGVRLQPGLVPVVEDGPVDRLGVDPQIAHAQRLELQSEGLEVAEQVGGRPAHRMIRVR